MKNMSKQKFVTFRLASSFIKTIGSLIRPLPLLLLLSSPALTHASTLYGVTNLGSFFATGINDNSWVTGYDGRALLWRPDSGLTEIVGPQNCNSGQCGNQLTAINNQNQAAGYVWYTGFNGTRAIVWDSDHGVTDMGDFPGGNNSSRAYAINENGAVAGRANGQYQRHPQFGNQGYQHAMLSEGALGAVELPDIPGGTQNSTAYGINDIGYTVGHAVTSNGWHALAWPTTQSMIDLGDLWRQAGGGESWAWDVNNYNQIAMQLELSDGTPRAGMWQEGTEFSVIDLLPGASNARANAINDDGILVGTAGTFGVAGTKAFSWSKTNGLVDLNEALDPLLGAGWLILEATGISDSGLIVGRGFHGEFGYRAIMLTPVNAVPIPGALWMFSIGLIVLARFSRRSNLV